MILEGEVSDLIVKNQAVYGVVLGDGSLIESKTVVLTTGTFLRGVMHVGETKVEGGRVGDGQRAKAAKRRGGRGG